MGSQISHSCDNQINVQFGGTKKAFNRMHVFFPLFSECTLDAWFCRWNLFISRLVFHLQAVQKDILQSGVQSKADQSPVTVADYGTICSSLQLPRFLPLMFATELFIRIWNSLNSFFTLYLLFPLRGYE